MVFVARLFVALLLDCRRGLVVLVVLVVLVSLVVLVLVVNIFDK